MKTSVNLRQKFVKAAAPVALAASLVFGFVIGIISPHALHGKGTM